MGSSSDEDEAIDLFKEPDDFYAPEKPASFTSFITNNGFELSLRLVGHNPLWGHLLWNAGMVTAKHIEAHSEELVRGKNVLELGAGAGLPSLVSALHGAKKVAVTDYPDPDLIDNLNYNIQHALPPSVHSNITALGYLWGNEIAPLTDELAKEDTSFDLLILADILFNHSEHEKLISTLQKSLKNDADARALVFFTPYRPWLLQKDLNFFELAKEAGFLVEKLFEHVMDKVMFPDDPGDEMLRRTVFAYEIRHPR